MNLFFDGPPCSLQFEGWSEAKRWCFLERLLSVCSEKHLCRVHRMLEPKVPKARADFTRHLPHTLCLRILGLLDPRTLCRASQVSAGWLRGHESGMQVDWLTLCA